MCAPRKGRRDQAPFNAAEEKAPVPEEKAPVPEEKLEVEPPPPPALVAAAHAVAQTFAASAAGFLPRANRTWCTFIYSAPLNGAPLYTAHD